MYTAFHIKASELNENFLKGLKTLFKSKRISIIVEEEQDETEYLLQSEANRKMLEESLNSKEGYEFSIEEFNQLNKNLLNEKKIDLSKIRKVKISK